MARHEAPKPALPDDAANRGGRSLLHTVLVTAVAGAGTAVYPLITSGDLPTLATMGLTAGAGALMAVTAYVHRKLEKYFEQRGTGG